jgi:hypothetical protein
MSDIDNNENVTTIHSEITVENKVSQKETLETLVTLVDNNNLTYPTVVENSLSYGNNNNTDDIDYCEMSEDNDCTDIDDIINSHREQQALAPRIPKISTTDNSVESTDTDIIVINPNYNPNSFSGNFNNNQEFNQMNNFDPQMNEAIGNIFSMTFKMAESLIQPLTNTLTMINDGNSSGSDIGFNLLNSLDSTSLIPPAGKRMFIEKLSDALITQIEDDTVELPEEDQIIHKVVKDKILSSDKIKLAFKKWIIKEAKIRIYNYYLYYRFKIFMSICSICILIGAIKMM